MRTWKDAFEQSLDRFADKHLEASDWNRSVDRVINNYFEPRDAQEEILLMTLRALAHQHLSTIFRGLEMALEKIESPIEHAMFMALAIVSRNQVDSVYYKFDGSEIGERDYGLDILCIEPQARLGKYRVDFLLTLRTLGPDEAKLTISQDGRQLIGSKIVEKKMVIECDGHDFHDRTKEQARRDRERDRFLQSIGYFVFRYTGAEIWSDVFEHADQAIRVLVRETNKEFYSPRNA